MLQFIFTYEGFEYENRINESTGKTETFAVPTAYVGTGYFPNIRAAIREAKSRAYWAMTQHFYHVYPQGHEIYNRQRIGN